MTCYIAMEMSIGEILRHWFYTWVLLGFMKSLQC